MRRLCDLRLVIGVASALAFASPQQTVVPTPLLSVRTDLVTLTATVTDRQGHPVTGLGRDDFVVYDKGERQTIQFFTSEDLPATIGLVIDSSASMLHRRDDVIAAGHAFAAISNPLDEFFTVKFNEWVWLGLPPGIPFTEDTQQLRAALSAAPTRGMTALYDAITLGLDHIQLGTRDRKALIVVSDGGDNASSRTLDDVLARARRTSAVIYAVTLFDAANHDARPRVLRQLARETGGRTFTLSGAADVMAAFAQIAREIRVGYTIGFAPTDAGNGSFHLLRVVADTEDGKRLIVRTRAGYYAGPPARTVE